MCAVSLAHLIIFGSRLGLLYGCTHILSNKWRRLGLVSQKLHFFHMESDNVIIAWDM